MVQKQYPCIKNMSKEIGNFQVRRGISIKQPIIRVKHKPRHKLLSMCCRCVSDCVSLHLYMCIQICIKHRYHRTRLYFETKKMDM